MRLCEIEVFTRRKVVVLCFTAARGFLRFFVPSFFVVFFSFFLSFVFFLFSFFFALFLLHDGGP